MSAASTARADYDSETVRLIGQAEALVARREAVWELAKESAKEAKTAFDDAVEALRKTIRDRKAGVMELPFGDRVDAGAGTTTASPSAGQPETGAGPKTASTTSTTSQAAGQPEAAEGSGEAGPDSTTDPSTPVAADVTEPPPPSNRACNRCNAVRAGTVGTCPSCGSPEFRLTEAAVDVVEAEKPAEKPARAKGKRGGKGKATDAPAPPIDDLYTVTPPRKRLPVYLVRAASLKEATDYVRGQHPAGTTMRVAPVPLDFDPKGYHVQNAAQVERAAAV